MKAKVPGEFKVLKWEVKDFIGDYRSLDYGDPEHPRIAQLREEYNLESVVGGCDTEFGAFLALKRWVRSQWNHGWSHSFDKVKDALDILSEAAKGEQFCCGHYATVFIESATALGWPARSVGIAIADCECPRDYHVGNVGHAVAEIWSNELEKWVLMDPDLNVHYERDGVPLNALEIREAWLTGQADRVAMVQDEPAFVMPSGRTVKIVKERGAYRQDWDEEILRLTCETFTRNRAMDYYARVRIGGWEWVDNTCLPTFVHHFDPAGETRWTSNVADMYWSVNRVRLSGRPSWDETSARLAVKLEHCMPFFAHYERRADGAEWERCDASFDWPMREGVNRLEVRAVNVRNRPGVASRLEVAYARPPAQQ